MESNNLSESFKKLGEAISEIAGGIIDAFSEALKEVLKLMEKIDLDKKLSRKKFIKLLMSKGIQRNEANKIAWEIHKEYGKYTLKNLLEIVKNKEE